MSSSDGEADPWDGNPRRMKEGLRQVVYSLEERTHRKIPADFTARHGRLMENKLKQLLEAFDQPGVLTEPPGLASPSLRSTSGPRGTRSDTERIAASLAQVQAERDTLLETSRLAADETTRLRERLAASVAEVAKLKAAAGGSLPPHPTLGVVEALREKAAGLTKTVALVESERDAARASFAAYEALGSPSAVTARVERLQVLLRLVLTALRSVHGNFVQQAALMAPMRLACEQRGRLLEQIFRTAAGSSSEALSVEVTDSLATILPELVVEVPPAAVEAGDKTHETSRGTGDDEDGRSSGTSQVQGLFGSLDVSWLSDLQEDALKALLGDADVHRLLMGSGASPDLRTAYETAASRVRGDESRTTRSTSASRASSSTKRADRMTPAATKTGTVEVVDLSSSPEKKQARDAATSFALPDPALGDGGLEKLSKKEFEAARKTCQTYMTALKRSLPQRSWPLGVPVDGLKPKCVRDLRETAWRLGWFPEERMAPTSAEYQQCLNSASGTRRFPSFGEVRAVYSRRPWRVLEDPPEPVTFSPDDPRFRRLYLNARKIYKTDAEADWERMHFMIPDPQETLSAEDSDPKNAWSDERRRRYARWKTHWTAHLQLLYQLFEDGVVDADLLLDPFFYWPPVHGVLLVLPRTDQDLTAYINEIDAVEPERLHFVPQELRAEHVSWQTPPASAGRSSQRVMERIAAKFVPPGLVEDFARPPTPPPAPSTRLALADQFASGSDSEDYDGEPGRPTRRAAPIAEGEDSEVGEAEEEDEEAEETASTGDADSGEDGKQAASAVTRPSSKSKDDTPRDAAEVTSQEAVDEQAPPKRKSAADAARNSPAKKRR